MPNSDSPGHAEEISRGRDNRIDFNLDEPLWIDEAAHFHHGVDGTNVLEELASDLRDGMPIIEVSTDEVA